MNKSMSEIKKEFEQADNQSLASLYAMYADDNRAGVVSLIAKYKKQEKKLEAEKKRMRNMQKDTEKNFRNVLPEFLQMNLSIIVGVWHIQE